MPCTPDDHRISRRAWLGSTAAGVAAVSAGIGPFGSPAIAQDAKKKSKQVLFIWTDGGMSQLESWDPKPNTTFGGPFRAISTSVPGIQLSEMLPRTATQMHHLAIARNICTQDNSHSAGVARIQRGDPKNRGVVYPFFGSAVSKFIGPGASGLPPYVWIKPGNSGFIYQDAGFLGAKYGALAFGDGRPPENLLRPESISEEQDTERQALRESFNRRYAAAHRPHSGEANSYVYDMARSLMKRQDLFDTARLDPRDVERYGTHEFGRHMLQARKMLEAGVTFVKVNSYGWDTHSDNFNAHASLMPKFDQAFAAIIEDLAERKMLDDVLVIALSEFGRTPRISGTVGRDHWPEAWSIAMAGAGIRRGAVVGKTNALGTFVDGEAYDIGHMFHTWFSALGIDSVNTQYDNHGQPLPIAHEECFAVKELLYMSEESKQLAARFTPKELKVVVADPQALTVRFSPCGKFLVAAGYDARIRRWDATKDDLPALSSLEGHNGWTQALAYSPDGKLLFCGDSWGQLRAWPVEGDGVDGQGLQPVWKQEAAHASWIRDVVVAPGGATLVTCGADKTIRVWSTADGAKQAEIRGDNDDLYVVRFSPDGSTLLAGDRKGIVWKCDLAAKTLTKFFDASILYKYDRIQDVGGVRCLAFDKTGAWLAVGGMKPKNGATIQGTPTLLLVDFKSGEAKQTHELGAVNDCDLMDVHLHEAGFFIAVTNGGPGVGKLVLQRLEEKEPFFTSSSCVNVQSLTMHPDGKRFAISGTNGGSNANGRQLDKDGNYIGNRSPIHVYAFSEMPTA